MATMADLDELALAMPEAVKELSGDGRPAYRVHGRRFLVHRGRFRMEYRDGAVDIAAGQFVIVPRGVEHRPLADEEVEGILFEPATTVRTGD